MYVTLSESIQTQNAFQDDWSCQCPFENEHVHLEGK